MVRILLCAVMLIALPAAPGSAQVWPAQEQVRVCPATPGETAPPDFNAEACTVTEYWRADPQERTIWIEAIIALDAAPDPLSGPYALFLSGKMAAAAEVNGEAVGANGRPGFNAAQETPGRLDAALFLPAQLLRAGENRIVLLASGHHSLIPLAAPVHTLAIAPFADPRRNILEGYQSSLAVFGVFALALVFFTVLAVVSRRRREPAVLAAIALTAGVQLVVELARGLVGYAYPVHDLRLMALAGGAALLAIFTAAWSVLHFLKRPGSGAGLLLAALVLVIAAVLFGAQGFDQKAGYTLVAGALAAAAPAALRAWRDTAIGPALWALGFFSMAPSAVLAQQSLMDRTVFWGLSVLLLVNIAGQARRFARERAVRQAETRRADALAAALARAEQAARPVQIPLVSAGRTDYASAADIVRLNAADDYVEVVFKDGRTVLHTGALARLEAQLPANFLRVHRSCVVNTDEIEALERDPGGSGRLRLKSGGEAPVSRRILPKVREALDSAQPPSGVDARAGPSAARA